MRPSRDITADHLRKLLRYDPESGNLYWLVRQGRCSPGELAGAENPDRYRRVGVEGRLYLAHRLIWLWMTGEWPKAQIDHIDCNRENNKWDNLREARPSQNMANTGKQKNNSTGYKGVYLDKRDGVYYARVQFNGRAISFGRFNDPYKAHLAYVAGLTALHGPFARWE